MSRVPRFPVPAVILVLVAVCCNSAQALKKKGYGPNSYSANPAATANQIILDESAGMSFAPAMVDSKITLCSDGTAYRDLQYYLTPGANYTTYHQRAQYNPDDFGRLCVLVHGEGFFTNPRRFFASGFVCDDGSIMFTVSRAGHAKSVSGYDMKSLFPLWVLENAVHGVTANLDWEPALPSNLLGPSGISEQCPTAQAPTPPAQAIRIFRGPLQVVDESPPSTPAVIHP